MAIDKAAGAMAGLKNQISPALTDVGGLKGKSPLGGTSAAGGAQSAEFKRALDQAGIAQQPAVASGLQAGLEKLKFSNHAIERMRSRGINFKADEMKGIESAVTKAAAKGPKDTLILSGDNALIVSVKNNTAVTVMDRAAMKENVFTNIDSTVVL